MGRRIIAGVLAVLLAAGGTFVLVMYVRGAEERALAGQQVVDVLVVSEAIQQGTAAEEIADQVETRQVTANVRAEGSVDDLDTLEGQVAEVDLMPGEQVVAGRFVDPAALEAAAEVEVPDGHQVITVEESAETAVGGQVVPGDTIGIIASGDCEFLLVAIEGEQPTGESEEENMQCTFFVAHQVLVTNVQGSAVPDTEEDSRDGQPDGSQMVSLAVDAADAERIAHVNQFFELHFTNQPEDADQEAIGQSEASILTESDFDVEQHLQMRLGIDQ